MSDTGRTDDEVIDAIVRQSQELQEDGCCSHPSSRGHLCPYHEGMASGAEAALRAVADTLALGRAVEAMPHVEAYGPETQGWNYCLDAIYAAAGVPREAT